MNNKEFDEFDNDPEVKRWRQERVAFQKEINDSAGIVCSSFNAENVGHKNLKSFLLYKSVSLPFMHKSYKGNYLGKKIYFCLFEYQSTVRVGRNVISGSDYYFAGVIELQRSYPHTLIQPETLAKKIEDIFIKADVDFKHSPKFSRKFHLVTNDRVKLEYLLSNSNLNKLTSHPAAEIELNGKQCYFRENRKSVSKEEAEKFVKLAKILFEIFY